MNKRIEELTLRTDAWCEQNLPANWTDDVDQYLPLWNAKFAELIVQECILTIQKGISLDGNTTEKFLRTMKHLKDIKEHFGIEE